MTPEFPELRHYMLHFGCDVYEALGVSETVLNTLGEFGGSHPLVKLRLIGCTGGGAKYVTKHGIRGFTVSVLFINGASLVFVPDRASTVCQCVFANHVPTV